MKCTFFTVFMPPAAVFQSCSITRCAAPISVFWITGLIGIAYGFMGGPLQTAGMDPYTVGLGLMMWVIASTWTYLTISHTDTPEGSLCHKERHRQQMEDTSDPLDEVRKANTAS